MAGRDTMFRHLAERVLRQYDYVQTIPTPPMTIEDLAPVDMVMSFTDFVVHEQEEGDPIREDEVWKHEIGYMKWFYRVSHPIIIAPAPVADYITHVPPY